METRFALINLIKNILGVDIVNLPYLYIDYWSFVHLASGLMLGVLFAVYQPGRLSWIFALAALAAYEAYERAFGGLLFVPERWVDILGDLIIGMAGYCLTYYLIRRRRKKSDAPEVH